MILPSIVLSFFSGWPKALHRPAYRTPACQGSLASVDLTPWFTLLEGEPPGELISRTTKGIPAAVSLTADPPIRGRT